jgi:6-phosphogluconolactonase
MRFLLCLAFLATGAATVQADTFVYASMAPEKTIRVFRLDPADGGLTKIDDIAVEGSPGCLTFSPSKKHLYASLRSNATLAAFATDAKTGKLAKINTVPLEKNANAAFICTDPSGKYLLSASYAGGKVGVHRLKDGAIDEPALRILPTAVTAHAVAFSPTSNWVFVPHVEPDALFQFRFDSESGTLREAGKAAGGKAIGQKPKAGPRHLAFHPKLHMAYSSDELGNSVTVYQFDPQAGLTPIETLTTLPSDFKGPNTTAEVKVHPNGKFVWVSNRGHDSLAGFAINPTTGKLTPLGTTATEKTPRSFAIEPDGEYLYAAGEGSGAIAVYRIGAQGTLERLRTVEVGRSVTWVTMAKFN